MSAKMDLESQAKKALATIYKDDNQSTDTAVHSPKPAEEPKASDSPTIKRTVQPAEKAPEEAVQDSSAVAALYNHHSKVVDAITKTPVTRDSKLAVLYIPGPHTASDRLLKNLTGISEPKIRIITARDSETAWLPQSSNDGQRGYDMHFAFNRLVGTGLGQGMRMHADQFFVVAGTHATHRVCLPWHTCCYSTAT